MAVRYSGSSLGLKYLVSIAHGFLVDNVKVAIGRPRYRARYTVAFRMLKCTLFAVTFADQGPLPYRAVSRLPAAIRTETRSATSSAVAIWSFKRMVTRFRGPPSFRVRASRSSPHKLRARAKTAPACRSLCAVLRRSAVCQSRSVVRGSARRSECFLDAFAGGIRTIGSDGNHASIWL